MDVKEGIFKERLTQPPKRFRCSGPKPILVGFPLPALQTRFPLYE